MEAWKEKVRKGAGGQEEWKDGRGEEREEEKEKGSKGERKNGRVEGREGERGKGIRWERKERMEGKDSFHTSRFTFHVSRFTLISIHFWTLMQYDTRRRALTSDA